MFWGGDGDLVGLGVYLFLWLILNLKLKFLLLCYIIDVDDLIGMEWVGFGGNVFVYMILLVVIIYLNYW